MTRTAQCKRVLFYKALDRTMPDEQPGTEERRVTHLTEEEKTCGQLVAGC